MNLHPASASSQAFAALRLLVASSMTATTLLALVFLGMRLTSAAEAASPPSALATSRPSIPPGYSSTILHLKLRTGSERSPLNELLPLDLRASIARMAPLFSLSASALDAIKATGEQRTAQPLADLNLWRQIVLKPGADAYGCMEYLRRLNSVALVESAPLPTLPPAITPDFTGNQGYLRAAPDGIAASYAWTLAGGNGGSVKIYDVEYSWNQTHEDLSKAHDLALLLDRGNAAVDPFGDNNHGTAILGELIADHDTKGVTGISWGADIGLAPANTANFGYNPANAILLAVADGAPGDVILIEQQASVCGLPDFGPSEWIASVFDAIHTAVANGFVVVEAAGNGDVNLDQLACGALFDRTVRDSGAIIVGAGGSPGSGYDRQRLLFSSYGSRVDLQGWGGNVMTTGYGNFSFNTSDPTNPDFWYTNTMNGTSSASPIVAGAAANLQGIALQQGGTPLTSVQLRAVLVQTGSPQVGNTAEHIGPRPDLRRAIAAWQGNHPPQAKCRNVVVLTDPVLCSAVSASVNAGSSDPDGGPLTLVQTPPGPYTLGTTTVTLTVSDEQGATDACTALVTVLDQQPPTIGTVAANPNTLWPPNHKMAPVTVAASAVDSCRSAPVCTIAAVSSNEPSKGKEKEDKEPDWQITGNLSVKLRAERAGNGNGRVYTLTIQCTDASQNSATKAVTVTVPH